MTGATTSLTFISQPPFPLIPSVLYHCQSSNRFCHHQHHHHRRRRCQYHHHYQHYVHHRHTISFSQNNDNCNPHHLNSFSSSHQVHNVPFPQRKDHDTVKTTLTTTTTSSQQSSIHHNLTPLLTIPESRFNIDASTVCKHNAFTRLILLTDGHLSQLLSILLQDTNDSYDTAIPSQYRSQSKKPIHHDHDHKHDYTHHGLDMRYVTTSLPTPFPPLPSKSPLHATHPLDPVRQSASFFDKNDRMFLYSNSTWCPNAYHSFMNQNPNIPEWQVFENLKLCYSRTVLAVHYGTCPQVAKAFGFPPSTPLWARDIVFRQHARPFLFVHQILSPALEEYVGCMDPPPSSSPSSSTSSSTTSKTIIQQRQSTSSNSVSKVSSFTTRPHRRSTLVDFHNVNNPLSNKTL